jgi:thioesterase III
MKKMEKIIKSQHKVRFQDCDPFNHLNNGKYIDYFINAREDQLIANYQIDVFEYAKKTGHNWVVASSQMAYKRPALMMETITIDSQLIKYTSKSLLVEMRMWDEMQTKLKALLWINFVHYDFINKRVADHTPEFIAIFEDVILPIEQSVFEERILMVK